MYGKKQGATYKINFDFLKYGVFRSYGVGRGYVMANGTVVKGYRVYSGKGSKGESTVNLMKKGYTLKEIKRMKRVSRFAEVKRTPLDWFNTHVSNEIETLADLVQNYYGDDALRNMMANIDKIKITKK